MSSQDSHNDECICPVTSRSVASWVQSTISWRSLPGLYLDGTWPQSWLSNERPEYNLDEIRWRDRMNVARARWSNRSPVVLYLPQLSVFYRVEWRSKPVTTNIQLFVHLWQNLWRQTVCSIRGKERAVNNYKQGRPSFTPGQTLYATTIEI